MIFLRMAAFMALAAAGPALAGGGLDTDFGDNGMTLIEGREGASPGSNFAAQLQVTANGRIVVAGTLAGENQGLPASVLLARLTPTGQLDATFGNGGFAAIGSGTERAYALAAQGESYLVGGKSDDRFAIWRIDANGNADATFGDGGTGATILGAGYVHALVPLASGTTLVAGWSSGAHEGEGGFSLVRLRADGSVDRSFGNNGFLVPAEAEINVLSEIAITATADEHFVLAGGDGPRLRAFRLLPDGALDATFGDAGFAVPVLGADNEHVIVNDIDVLADGKIIVSGYVGEDPWFLWPGRGFVVRLNADGSLDSGFADAGVFETDPQVISEIAATTVGPDEIIYAAATRTTHPEGSNWTGENRIVALDAGGRLVQDFGVGGLLAVGTVSATEVDNEIAVDIAPHGGSGLVILGDGWGDSRRIIVARIGLGAYPGIVGFRSDAGSASQQAGVVEIELHRWGGTHGEVTAAISVDPDSTATAGADFILLDDSVQWADGESGARTVRLQVIDDGAANEARETVVLAVSITVGGASTGMTTYTLVLLADPAPPVSSRSVVSGGGTLSPGLLALLLLLLPVNRLRLRCAGK